MLRLQAGCDIVDVPPGRNERCTPGARALKRRTIAMAGAQVWKNSKFTIDRNQGKAPGTVIFRLSGPFTARDMHGALSPNDLRNTFESEEDNNPHALPIHALHILDLTEVPYMDSAGLGLIVSHYVRCPGRGVRLVAAGVSPRWRP